VVGAESSGVFHSVTATEMSTYHQLVITMYFVEMSVNNSNKHN